MEYDADVFEIVRTNHQTLNMETSEEYIKTLVPNSCVMIVHNLGNIINVPRLQRLRPDIVFLEDNCEGLFGKYENQYSGTASLCSAVSFYGNKTITTGEGGAFFTSDKDVYKYIQNIYSHGMSEKRYIHNNLGNNFRMTNIEAAFLYDQLNDYQHILSLKNEIFHNYDVLFEPLIKNHLVVKTNTDEHTVNSHWLYCIVAPNIAFDKLESFMEQKNVQIRPIFYDLHQHAHLKNLKKTEEDQFTSDVSTHGIMLPSYPELTLNEQEYIASCITEYIRM
jgi:perosamine synthetase